MRPCGHEELHYVGEYCAVCLSMLPTPDNTSWRRWADTIAICIDVVPDSTLRLVAEVIIKSRIVLTAGNGGSASLASHAAQAIMKPDYKAGGGCAALCLNDAVPTHTAHANDGGWDGAMLEIARPFLGPHAALVLFSSSGKSPNIVALAQEARNRQLEVVAFTGFKGGPLRSLATLSIHADSDDYEVVEPVHDALMHRVQYHLRQLGKETK